MTDRRGTNTKFNFNDDVKVLRRIIENSGTNHFLGGTLRPIPTPRSLSWLPRY